MAIIITLWIMFAVTCAVIAASKNRNPIVWAALGLIAGIFALVAVCAMPALRRSQSSYSGDPLTSEALARQRADDIEWQQKLANVREIRQ